MKKIIYTLLIGVLIASFPSNVLAEDAAYAVLVNDVLNGTWESEQEDGTNYVDIVIPSKITAAQYDATEARRITIYYCNSSDLDESTTCTVDIAEENDTYISFELDESTKNLITYTTSEIYKNFTSAKLTYYYSVEDDSFNQLKTGSLKIIKINVKEDESITKMGTQSNPYIIENGTGSITIPASTDSVWSSTSKKLYFKVEMPETETGSYGRYKISDNALGTYIYAFNSAYSDVNNNSIMHDADEEELWLFRPTQTYYLYAEGANAYGKTMTITFVDNKMITLYTDVGFTEAENTYGDLEIDDPDKTYDAIYGCAILGDNVTKWVKWLIAVLRVIVPLGIVVLTILDFTKIVASGEDKEYKAAIQKLVKRIVIAVAIFVVPALVALLIDLSGILTQYGITDDIFCSLF